MFAKSLLQVIVSVNVVLLPLRYNSQLNFVILSAKTLVLTVELTSPPIHINPVPVAGLRELPA
jgi:hypothetical protein